MASEFIAGLGLFKSMLDMAKGLKDINDAAVRNGAVVELLEKIMSAHMQHTELVEENRKLKEEIRRFENWEAEKERYELTEIRRGVVARSLKPAMANGEPPHKICAYCYENGKNSPLQAETRYPGGSEHLVCHGCGSDLVVNGSRQGPLPKQAITGRRRH